MCFPRAGSGRGRAILFASCWGCPPFTVRFFCPFCHCHKYTLLKGKAVTNKIKEQGSEDSRCPQSHSLSPLWGGRGPCFGTWFKDVEEPHVQVRVAVEQVARTLGRAGRTPDARPRLQTWLALSPREERVLQQHLRSQRGQPLSMPPSVEGKQQASGLRAWCELTLELEEKALAYPEHFSCGFDSSSFRILWKRHPVVSLKLFGQRTN